MEELWVVTAEVIFPPGDLASGNTKAFINAIAWADSAKMANDKVAECCKEYAWYVIGIEAARPFDEDAEYSEEILAVVERARNNPKACIFGTALSYKPD